MESTSHSLLERLRQPAADQAWERFVHLYTPVLFAWAGRAGLQDSDADDLLQEVFVVLAQKLPEFSYKEGGSFRAWLRTVTLNKLRDWKRRQGRNQTAPLDDVDPAGPGEEFWEREYRREVVVQALQMMQAEFAPNTWQACWTFLTSGRSALEVAKQSGLSENAVYIAKCRVLRRLRQEFDGMLD